MKEGRTSKRAFGLFLCVALVSACHRSDVPTAEENQQLDNSEAMLDSAADTLNAVDSGDLNSGDAMEPGVNKASPHPSQR